MKAEVLPSQKSLDKAKKAVTKAMRTADQVDEDPKTLSGVAKELMDMDEMVSPEHRSRILHMEWAIMGGNTHPREWLMEIKGLSHEQAKQTMKHIGTNEKWIDARLSIQDKTAKNLIERHTVAVAKSQDEFIRSGKTTMAKALEALTSSPMMKWVEETDPTTSKVIRKKLGGLSTMDLLNITTTIEKAQRIYMRAMGMDDTQAKDETLLNTKSAIERRTMVTLSTVPIEETAGSELVSKGAPDPRLDHLNYDDVMAIVEFRRKQNAALESDNDDGDGESEH